MAPRAKEVVHALISVETGGTYDCSLKGKSGENGCLQFMPSTWQIYSKQTIGKVVEQTTINEKYVAIKKVSEWLYDGYTPREIALIWNGGEVRCKAGVNKYGATYDTCAYANKFLSYLD